mgnify:FL=1
MICSVVQQIDETNEIDQDFNIIRHTYKTTCLMTYRLFTQWDLISYILSKFFSTLLDFQ